MKFELSSAGDDQYGRQYHGLNNTWIDLDVHQPLEDICRIDLTVGDIRRCRISTESKTRKLRTRSENLEDYDRGFYGNYESRYRAYLWNPNDIREQCFGQFVAKLEDTLAAKTGLAASFAYGASVYPSPFILTLEYKVPVPVVSRFVEAYEDTTRELRFQPGDRIASSAAFAVGSVFVNIPVGLFMNYATGGKISVAEVCGATAAVSAIVGLGIYVLWPIIQKSDE